MTEIPRILEPAKSKIPFFGSQRTSNNAIPETINLRL